VCQRPAHTITLSIELFEQLRDLRVINRAAVGIGKQILLADICDIGTVVILGQQVIEWLFTARTDVFWDGFVPLFAICKDRIDIEDHTAKIEHPVANHIANPKARLDVSRGLDRAASLAGKEHSSVHSG